MNPAVRMLDAAIVHGGVMRGEKLRVFDVSSCIPAKCKLKVRHLTSASGEATPRKQWEKEDVDPFPSPSMFSASFQPPSPLHPILPPLFF